MADVIGTDQADILDASDGVSVLSDRVFGLGGNDELYGLGGDDTLDGGAGADLLDGGTGGGDRVDYSASPLSVIVSLLSGGVGGDANGDIYVGIEDIEGSDFQDLLIGDDGDNFIFGGEGDDVIQGKGGVDHLFGQGGDDLISAGDGNDTDCAGGDGNDKVNGGSGNNGGLSGGNGDDAVNGLGGNDTISGGAGSDTCNGGDGDDFIFADNGADKIDGGTGIDKASYANSTIGLIIDLLAGTVSDGGTIAGIEGVFGTKFDDIIAGTAEANNLSGFDGIDQVSYAGSNAAVTVDLGTGAVAGGHAEGDVLDGIEGAVGSQFGDTLAGSDGLTDRLSGLGGNDTILGSLGADVLDGGDGLDRVDFGASDAAVTINLAGGVAGGGHAQGDTLTAIEFVTGSAFDDVLVGDGASNQLFGGDGADLLAGGAGNDLLRGGAGTDEIYGGAGRDTASYAGSKSGVQVSLAAETAAGGDAKGDTLGGIESLSGSSLDDTLTGNAGTNELNGGNGRDTLAGDAGADALIGGRGTDILRGGRNDDRMTGGDGADKLTGGAGSDRFEFEALGEGGDLITDFTAAEDAIVVTGSAFGGGLATGKLQAANFQASATNVAANVNVRFVFETDVNILWFDADGNGAGAAMMVAGLQDSATMSNTDILVV